MRVTWTNKMQTFDEPTEDDVPGNALHIITYARGTYRQLYFNVTQIEAVRRFERRMTQRNRFEIVVEGWDATIESVRLINGEAWIGDIRADLQLMCDLMMSAAAPRDQVV